MALSSQLLALYVVVTFVFGSLTLVLHRNVRDKFQLLVPDQDFNLGGERFVEVPADNNSINDADAAIRARPIINEVNEDEEETKNRRNLILATKDETLLQTKPPIPLEEVTADQPLQNSTTATATATASFDDFYNRCNATRKGEGVIVLNFVGLMANNFFELAHANRLAKDLCWKILYRPDWNHELPNERAKQCLPNAFLPEDYTQLPELDSETARELDLTTQESWERIATSKKEYQKWIHRFQEQYQVVESKVFHYDPERVIRTANRRNSRIRIINLRAFFIHYTWMEPHLKDIRQQLALHPDCCHKTPPKDAVVFHVRDFDNPDDGGNIQYDKVYTQLIRHYNWTDRPIWVVCQPKTVNSPVVSAIRNATESKSITVIPGKDQYDAFCTLTRSTTLVGSAASSFSQLAAVLMSPYDSREYHMFLPRIHGPRVTMHVPHWKYHLVAKNRVEIDTYDIPHEKVTFKSVT